MQTAGSTSGTGSARNYFDGPRSSRYDHKIRASIPGYEALHAMAHDFLRQALPEQARILVVGSGTGMELLTLGAAHTGWRFTATDLSSDMLAIGKVNVEAAGLADREDPSFAQFLAAWKGHYGAAGIPEAEVDEDFARTDATVSFIPEQDLRGLLADSGFFDVRRFFQAFLFGGWVARKG